MDKWNILKSELIEKHGITALEHVRSIKTTISGNKCIVEGKRHALSYDNNRKYILTSQNETTDVPPVLTHMTGTTEDPIISFSCWFYGTDSAGKKSYYNVEYYYRQSTPDKITITKVDTIYEDLDDLIQVGKNNGLPIYAAFQQGSSLIIHPFIGYSRAFDIPGNTVVKTEFNEDFDELNQTKHNFFTFDDNSVYLNQIVGDLFNQVGYVVTLESYPIFTNRQMQARITSIEPVNHEKRNQDLDTFNYLDKCTVIVTYDNGQKQLLIINDILGPKRRIFRTKLYDDINYIQNCRDTIDTNGNPITLEVGLQFELTNGDEKEYYFISADRKKKNGKRKKYKKRYNIVQGTEDTE